MVWKFVFVLLRLTETMMVFRVSCFVSREIRSDGEGFSQAGEVRVKFILPENGSNAISTQRKMMDRMTRFSYL